MVLLQERPLTPNKVMDDLLFITNPVNRAGTFVWFRDLNTVSFFRTAGTIQKKHIITTVKQLAIIKYCEVIGQCCGLHYIALSLNLHLPNFSLELALSVFI